jgi:hypothetical protein
VTEKFSQEGKVAFNGQESVVSGQRIPDRFHFVRLIFWFFILAILVRFRHFRQFYTDLIGF